MEFGVEKGRNVRMNEIARHAKLTDESEHNHLTLIESQNVFRDVYAMMDIAALNTHRIRIGHGVTNPPGVSVAGFFGPLFIGE